MATPAVLLIVGKGETWQDDLSKFRAMGVPHDVMGINHAALWLADCPKHAFSYHPDVMGDVKRERPEVITHSLAPFPGVDHVHRMRGEKGGSSAYIACRLALEVMGYQRVALAGVPLNGEYFLIFVQQWINGRARIMGRVKSLSGATYALLGAPTKAWMEGTE